MFKMVTVDKDTCIGCGACAATCPEGFVMGSDGKADVNNADADCVQAAADGCPVDAIKV